MKTTKLFAMLGMAAALFTGCSSDEESANKSTSNGITVGVEYSIDSVTRVTPANNTAVYSEEMGGVPVSLFDPQWSAQSADTRMTHDDYGTGDFLWESNDKLGLVYCNYNALTSGFVVDYLDCQSGAGTKAGTFYRVLNLTLGTGRYLIAPFYPYTTKYGTTTISADQGNKVKQYIDTDQGDGKSWKNYAFAFSNTANVAVTSTTQSITLGDNTLDHKNTYVKFTVRSGNNTYVGKLVQSIEIKAPSSIAGTYWGGASGVSSWVSGTESSSIKLSSAAAFQGTIKSTCTNLGNYKYNTAYSAQGSMMVIKAGSFTPTITVTLTDGTVLQRTMANAIDFKAGYLRIINLNLDDFNDNQQKQIVNIVSSNTTQGTINQPTQFHTTVPSFSTVTTTGGWKITANQGESPYTQATVQPATGYIIVSWTKPDGTVIPVGSGTTTDSGQAAISADGTLTISNSRYDGGTWTANFGLSQPSQYTIYFDGNGGTPSVSTMQGTNGQTISLPSCTRSGYAFDGWYTDRTGGTLMGGSGSSYVITGSQTLYAHWTAVSTGYYIAFTNSTGGYLSNYGSYTQYYSSGTASSTATANSGYTFSGWYKNGVLVSSNAILTRTYMASTSTDGQGTYEARFQENTRQPFSYVTDGTTGSAAQAHPYCTFGVLTTDLEGKTLTGNWQLSVSCTINGAPATITGAYLVPSSIFQGTAFLSYPNLGTTPINLSDGDYEGNTLKFTTSKPRTGGNGYPLHLVITWTPI